MNGAPLKKLGFILLLLAAALAWVAPHLLDASSPLLSSGPRLARNAAVLGGLLLAIGFAAEIVSFGQRRCARCSRRAASGSALCEEHRREVAKAARVAARAAARDHRSY